MPRMARTRVLEYVRDPDGVWNLPATALGTLIATFPDVEFVSPPSRADADAQLADVDVVLGFAVRRENFARARRLRWIHSTAASVTGVLFPELVESEVVVTNARGLHAVSMAEHALAMMLAFARQLHLSRDAQHERRWSQSEQWSNAPGFGQLDGATLGLVGVGAVGGALARRARGLGMHVIAVRRRAQSPAPDVDEVWGPERLHALLERSDFVVIAAPLTPATRGLIDAAALARMKPGALLVNLGRGALVDEPALLEALRSGRLAGAALDVFAEEPLPADSPWWSLPQVLATPHVSGVGPAYWERSVEMFSANLRAFVSDAPLFNVVNKREGY